MRALTSFQRMLRERFTVAGWVVLGAAGIAAAAGVETTQTMTYQAFAFLASMLGISWLTSIFFRKATLEVHRQLPRYATAGEPLVYELSLRNAGTRRLAD